MSDKAEPAQPSVSAKPAIPSGEAYQRWVERMRIKARENMIPLCLGGLIFSFIVVLLFNQIFILISPGESGVLFRRLTTGTETETIYGEGMSIIAPWNKMFIYNLRVQERTQVVEALSQNGLTIRVSVSMRFFPEPKDLPALHQKVGPDYVEKIVVPEVVTAVREVIGKYLPQQLYTENTRAISNAIIESAVRSVGEKFIRLDDVNIQNIRLPQLVTSAIESKLTQEQLAEEYKFRQERQEKEAIRLKTEADGIAGYNQVVSASLSPEMLRYKGIEATLDLAKSNNSKVIVVGSGRDGLPLILNTESAQLK